MDLIFFNGKIITVDRERSCAGAVAVKNGCIAAVGDDDDILTLKDGKTDLVDLRGRTLLPGFNDSHMHLTNYALGVTKVDLRGCDSIDDLVERIRRFIAERKVPKGEWVLGWGWNHSFFREKRMPDRYDLDRAAPGHCLSIVRTCCHVSAVNSMALQRTGINDDPPMVDGGDIDLDATGKPTGILKENAMKLVEKNLPSLDRGKIEGLIRTAAADFNASGLTSVQTDDLLALDSDLLPDLLAAYRNLESSDALPIRVDLQLLLPDLEKLGAFIENEYRVSPPGPFFKIGPLKLLMDGSLGGRTALLAEPYADDPDNRGMAVLAEEELAELVNLAYENGMQVATHAIGDAAVSAVLDAYEKAGRRCCCPDPRFRIVHASIVSPDSLKRFAELGVIADIQPAFVSSDNLLIEKILGPERAAWTYRWRDFLNSGVMMGGGSDCPVETCSPLYGLYAAVTRQNARREPPGGWFPGQRLNLSEIIGIYTFGSAYCSFEEKSKGSIAVGKLADLVVLSEDILQCRPEEIRELQIDQTVVGGKTVYLRPGSPA